MAEARRCLPHPCVFFDSLALSLARPYNIALGQSMLPPLMRAVTLICALLSLSLAGPKSFYAGRPLSGWKFFISLCTAGCCPASARARVFMCVETKERPFLACVCCFLGSLGGEQLCGQRGRLNGWRAAHVALHAHSPLNSQGS